MSTRLSRGGRLIDRTRRLHFTFDGHRHSGYAGDTLAAALMAEGRMLMGRSFKYHRPRGPVACGVEEPNALVTLGSGARIDPNQRATVSEIFDGLEARSQNRWPSLGFDVGEINAAFSRFLPAGFYYKTFIHPRRFWKHVYEPMIRRAAGLGRPPTEADADRYEHFHAHVDVAVVGGGVAGLQAALVAGHAGCRVIVMEQATAWGGRAPVDGATIDGQEAEAWVAASLDRLRAMENVHLLTRTTAAGIYDHGYLLAEERVADHCPGGDAPRHRLWRIRARRIVTATGAIERPLAFAGNDVPGVMLASAIRDYVVNYAVSPGDRTVVVTSNDDAYRTALALHDAGLIVPAILDARPAADGPLPKAARARGLRVETGTGIAHVEGRTGVKAVAICAQAGEGRAVETIECDAVAMSGGWSPAVHLWSHCGGKLVWDETQAHFAPDPKHPPTGADGEGFVVTAGSASGRMDTGGVLADATDAGVSAVEGAGGTVDEPHRPGSADAVDHPPMAVWIMPQGAGPELRAKMWLDYQNDVKVSDMRLAAQEGFVGVEHAKRYTTLGMATDQGKLSNINGLGVLAEARGEPLPAVGTTTFRPPYTPISMGSIAGAARGAIFQPVRRTPFHGWHEANGATFEPVGRWRRPYAYPQAGESVQDTVAREVRDVRTNVGLLDASTLGKIVVKGPDAGRFLDMLYTNMMSNLGVGRCRYGLMCSENGFLIDDGVVARLSQDAFLCHTTTGGAERIHAHMEEWLQTEWWDWQVHTANVTEQFAQIAVVGPRSRELLQALGGVDVTRETLPFMGWIEGDLAGIPARIFRISFSGELSFEIAVPAGRGRELWDRLIEAGAAFGVMPYGTEALHVLRAEKGFIMIGDETDGTVIPQDLGLGWAISKKKADFIGKRGQERSHMTDPERWRLVGMLAADGAVLPDGAHVLAPGRNANGQRNTDGRVTSTYYSPTLGHGIAMALVRRGPERMGESVVVQAPDGGTTSARIVDPAFYDKKGERLDG